VATAGDVNGDGYSDVIMGAPYYANGQADEGRAFLWLGSGTGLGADGTPENADWAAEGDQQSAFFGNSVATAGDVNGDGYSDIIIGAYGYDNVQMHEGRAFVYLGDGEAGRGFALKPQQRRANDGAPVDKLGKSDSTSSFRLASLGRAPFGRGDVKLELEVKPLGTLFDGSGTQLGASWTDSGVSGGALNELVSPLSSGTNYHWRARLHYSPATTPFQARSRWFAQPWGGWQETDLRTTAPCAAPSSLTNNTAADLDACADTGARITWAQDPGNWGDSGGSRTYDILRDGTLLQAGIAFGTTSYNDTTGTNGTTYTYTVRYNNGCGLNAVTMGGGAADHVGAAPSGLTNNTAADLDACADTGVRITWAQDAGDWDDLGSGTRTYDVLRDGSPLQTGIAYGTATFDDATGTNGTTYTYAVRYNNGCGMNAATSGAPAADYLPPPEVTTLYLRKDSYPAGIVSAWHFEEGAGTTAADTPGSNDGTLVNGPVWAGGHSGTALSFDGTDDYVSVPNDPSLNPAQITVAAWIKADAWTAESWRGSILAKDQQGPDSGWVLRCGNGGILSFVVSIGGWRWADTNPLMSLNTWTHVAGTYDGTTLRAYINGEERASTSYSGAITASTVPLGMGASTGWAGRLFDGMIDEAAVFNRALSGPEIQDLYQTGFAGLVFEWTPQVPPPDAYEVFRAAGPQGPFDTPVGTAGGAFGSLNVFLAAQPAEAYYKIRAVAGSCPGPL